MPEDKEIESSVCWADRPVSLGFSTVTQEPGRNRNDGRHRQAERASHPQTPNPNTLTQAGKSTDEEREIQETVLAREGEIRRELGTSLSRVLLFVISWTVACQAPQSMGFSRQEYWSGLPFPSPGDLPNSGIESGSPALQADSLLSEPPGKPPKLPQPTPKVASSHDWRATFPEAAGQELSSSAPGTAPAFSGTQFYQWLSPRYVTPLNLSFNCLTKYYVNV